MGAVLATDGSGNMTEPLPGLRLDPGKMVTPTGLSADVDNYNPTGLSSAIVLFVDPNGASRNITGLTATYNGHLLLVVNIADGAEDLVLKNENASSVAANRFYGANNADITIRRGGAVWLLYHGATSRWAPVAI